MAEAIVKRIENAWYDELVADLRKLEFTGIVYTKHAIGLRILQDESKFGKPKYGSKRIEGLAKDLQISQADLYFCIQFVKKYPTISNALENLPWRAIIKLLPTPKPDKPDTPPLPEGIFDVLYADVHWKYGQEQHGKEKQETVLESHYPTMATMDIAALPVREHVAENAVAENQMGKRMWKKIVS